jgi:hypothetical protein
MAKNKKQIAEEETVDAVEETTVATPAEYAKPKLSDAQIKQLLKDYSKVTLKARGII